MHVDALDAATGLPGVEEGAVDCGCHRMAEVGVGAHVGRVLAAQLQADADEAPRRCPLDHGTARHRAGEGHMLDRRRLDQLLGIGVAQVQVLEHAVGQTGLGEGRNHAFGAQRGLRRVLEQHRVAGQQRRHHRVHRGQVGIVPGRDDQGHAQRFAADETGEAGFVRQADVGQGALGDIGHVAGALDEAADLAGGVADRPAHHPAQLLGQLLFPGGEGGDGLATDGHAFGQRGVLPALLRPFGLGQGGLYFTGRSQVTLDIQRTVDGGYAVQFAHCSLRRLLFRSTRSPDAIRDGAGTARAWVS
ncbi:hypothetical protein D3C80_1293210 [compost metagenome]